MPGLPRSLCSSLLFTIDKNYEIDTGLQLYIDLYLVVNSITVCESYVSVTPPCSDGFFELERKPAKGIRYRDCKTIFQGALERAALAVIEWGVGVRGFDGWEAKYTHTTSLYFGEYVRGTWPM
jgi:hypothetical protein